MRPYTIAERYARARAKHPHTSAQQAFRIAKSEAADYRLSRALDEPDDEFHAEFSEREGRFLAYQLDNGGALRVELEFVNDDSGMDWDTKPEELEELYSYYRLAKMGKVQARDAARELRERQQQQHNDKQRGEYYQAGIIVRVYWRGEEVASESLWSVIHETEDDLYSTTRDVIGNARYEARKVIRAKGRDVRGLASEFGFPPVAGYRPAMGAQ